MVVFLRRRIKHFQFMSVKVFKALVCFCFISIALECISLEFKQVSTGHELMPLCQVQQVDKTVFDWLDHKIYKVFHS